MLQLYYSLSAVLCGHVAEKETTEGNNSGLDAEDGPKGNDYGLHAKAVNYQPKGNDSGLVEFDCGLETVAVEPSERTTYKRVAVPWGVVRRLLLKMEDGINRKAVGEENTLDFGHW
ncbi:hypothetical protein O6H91_10G101100 [Diphasiastrum complanatum]|uniref:Uncharacterized protein n=1 Tax=Diphasiastrum complanatum TaxID=34168 RepID=A0ACC2CK06_DIPCM|nr:hypothetical protein O6H91_10G101100 [Diphasiastrum complanatum]